jgi:hypothetical protein
MEEHVTEKLLTPREAAKLLSVCGRTLWRNTEPRGPLKAVRISPKCIRYSPRQLNEFIRSRSTI